MGAPLIVIVVTAHNRRLKSNRRFPNAISLDTLLSRVWLAEDDEG
jgi:hypothetical protein